jgi:endogenous inhibitor of DNA gyrase (YacG/DUF329 family)
LRVACPTCKREIEWSSENAFRPFCSERCRMVDLGAWFTGERAIPDDAPSTLDGEPSEESGQRTPGD